MVTVMDDDMLARYCEASTTMAQRGVAGVSNEDLLVLATGAAKIQAAALTELAGRLIANEPAGHA